MLPGYAPPGYFYLLDIRLIDAAEGKTGDGTVCAVCLYLNKVAE